MNLERFLSQVESAEKRFIENSRCREKRIIALKKLGGKSKASKSLAGEIDDSARISERFLRLSRDRFAGKGIIAKATSPDSTETQFLERIINQNDLLSADFLHAGASASNTVGRVVVRSGSGIVIGFGTCSMVSDRLAMTNNHVIANRFEAANCTVQFNFLETLNGEELSLIEFNFDPDSFFQTDEKLDFTLLAVEAVNSDGVEVKTRGWNPLIAESGKAIVGERVNVIQHPNGERQQLALRKNQIVDVVGDFLHYSSDTERGSSGSPVLNDQWQLAALHHAGVPERNVAGKILLVSNAVWDGSKEQVPQIKWKANEGARISRIVEELRKREATFTNEQKKLFDRAFSPPLTGKAEKANREVTGQNSQPKFENGQLSWTVPIEFSISVPFLAQQSSQAPNQQTKQPDSAGAQSTQFIDEFTQRAISRANAAFAIHKNDPYYDEAADDVAITDYYHNIEDDAVGNELFDALNVLLTTTHTNELDYAEARYDHLYPWIDLRNNRKLASIYSDDPMDFSTLITQESFIDARHEVAVREFMRRESAFEQQDLESFRFQLETSDPFNCEHIVPQSWFNKKFPMKADLHHLTTCEPRCNSSRGNNAYFEFDPDGTPNLPNCGQVDGSESKFEPIVGKGTVARASLYYLLRYPGSIGSSLLTGRIATLLKWHSDHEVTEYEKHRNAEIQKVQGNRNPLIDFPLWAEHIPFENSLS